MTDAFDRAARASGVAAAVGTLGAILLATAVAPGFAWAGDALSDLGVAGGIPELLFNGGLLVGGALGLPFAWWRGRRARDRLGLAAGVAFGLAMGAMAGIGAFPSGTALHAPFAIAFYLLLTYTLALDGSAAVRRGDASGLVWLWAALGHLTAWLLWAVWNVVAGDLGLALPETVGAALLAGWVLATAGDETSA